MSNSCVLHIYCSPPFFRGSGFYPAKSVEETRIPDEVSWLGTICVGQSQKTGNVAGVSCMSRECCRTFIAVLLPCEVSRKQEPWWSPVTIDDTVGQSHATPKLGGPEMWREQVICPERLLHNVVLLPREVSSKQDPWWSLVTSNTRRAEPGDSEVWGTEMWWKQVDY